MKLFGHDKDWSATHMADDYGDYSETLAERHSKLAKQYVDMKAFADAQELEVKRLTALINTPHTSDFLEAVRLEAAHQRERWGFAHDRSKSAESWFWLLSWLAGKALRAAIDGDREKALHHTISSGAMLMNWHEAIIADPTGVGLGEDVDLAPKENKQ